MRWRHRFDFVDGGGAQGRGRDRRAQGPLPERHRADAGGDVQARRVRQVARHADHHARLPHRRLLRAHRRSPNWCRHNGVLLHIHRAHARRARPQPRTTASTSACWPRCLRLSGGDHLHSGTVVGKLEGDREATLGWIDLMREKFIPEDRSRGIFFDQDWGSMPGAVPGRLRRHPRLAHAGAGRDLRRRFGAAVRRRHAGPPVGQRRRRRANRVALEACVEARNEGREVEKEAARSCAQRPGPAPSWPPRWRPGRKSSSSSTPSTSSTSRTSRSQRAGEPGCGSVRGIRGQTRPTTE